MDEPMGVFGPGMALRGSLRWVGLVPIEIFPDRFPNHPSGGPVYFLPKFLQVGHVRRVNSYSKRRQLWLTARGPPSFFFAHRIPLNFFSRIAENYFRGPFL